MYIIHDAVLPSSLSLCVARPPLVVWLCDSDQEPCVYGLGCFGHWHSWSCILIDYVARSEWCDIDCMVLNGAWLRVEGRSSRIDIETQ